MRYVILAAALAVAGCSSKKEDPGPTCAQVTDHLFEVTKIAYPGHGDMAMGDRKAEIAQCEKRAVSADERRCIMAAADMAGVAKCRAGAQPARK
jgi:hypothetical protein